ncbi:hypothetical protein F8154_01160 [Alkaliphilus pronyensis]|uniref:Uncharacterized protein n=1 Tax=Alkaliphilus pronyensis TaxID=1482732 RepID=A0A6I0F8M1_9FIRM|nr:hypothetical protein [Alkaliphilus pronyensis]KAB3539070.1 hypothetical protein F8154_01160 [Alkaliphilus pronyensis]
MKGLTAQNGLQFTVDIGFNIILDSSEYKWFERHFGNLISYDSKLMDTGVNISFKININEELSRMGRFKDVPSKTEVKRYLPIVLTSDTYLKSDIVFLKNVNQYYIEKEKAKGRRITNEAINVFEKVKESINEVEISINNLML